MSKPSSSQRLDRLLANLGYGTRKQIQTLAKAGQIRFKGVPLKNSGHKVALASDLHDSLSVAGEKLDPLPGLALMMNKPLGMTCSHKEAGPLVYDLLPARWRLRKPAISTVGRLDKDTSGLLLFTDDGGLLHRIISPKNKIAKRYLATLTRPLFGNESEIFASGTLILQGDDKPLLPAILDVPGNSTQARLEKSGPSVFLTITEGRYHQVRRMFAAVGNDITALHRVSIGGLSLPDELADGTYRLLDVAQVNSVFTSKSPAA